MHRAAVIFDMDGLLIDSEPLWHRAEAEVLSAAGAPIRPADCTRTTGLRSDAVVGYWQQRYALTRPAAELVLAIEDRVAALIRAEAQPMPGAASAVALCAARGLPLAVASSSSPVIIEAGLARLGLRAAFAVVHSAAGEALGKPHPAVYLHTAERLDVAPERCVALEDSMNGMLAAKAARMRVIAVPERGAFGRTCYDFCDVKLPSLSELSSAHLEALQKNH